MNEIKCPKCGATISVDDSIFAAILEQVRTTQFNKEIESRMAELNEQFSARAAAVRTAAEKDFEKMLANRDVMLGKMQNELTRLQGIIDGFEANKKSALSELATNKARELFDAVAEKDKKIAELEAQIAKSAESNKVAILEERNALAANIQAKELQISKLQSEIEAGRLSAANHEAQLREQFSQQLKDKDDEIERLQNFRLRLSTKMVGETLEQHCSIKFEEAQSMGQFPEAKFTKDNQVVEGTKGDFILRDYIDGQEYVSIMFDMKNEVDTTATKHRNDDFLEKLHKDRERKGCEYAVLVSMLEQDSELYNNGIVDKSYRYPKMIVIRPQFFLPVVRLICESAKKAYMERHELIRELELARNQSMDFAKFEARINRFRESFSKNVVAAHKRFADANNGIDKVIENLERQIKQLRDVKAAFEASDQRLFKANELADEDLTIKKLTRGNPSIRKMIQDAADGSEA